MSDESGASRCVVVVTEASSVSVAIFPATCAVDLLLLAVGSICLSFSMLCAVNDVVEESLCCSVSAGMLRSVWMSFVWACELHDCALLQQTGGSCVS